MGKTTFAGFVKGYLLVPFLLKVRKFIFCGVKTLNHVGTKTIKTDRIILRKYEMKDAEDIFSNWVTDCEVSIFWGWNPHENIEETKSLLGRLD